MIALDKLSSILKETAKLINYLALVQHSERKRLVDSLANICMRCEESFELIYARITSIRRTYGNTDSLIVAVQGFIDDHQLALQFKPEHLCSEIDSLLTDLESYLEGLRYSIASNSISVIKMELGNMHHCDISLNEQYNLLREELRNLIDSYEIDKNKLNISIIRDILNGFEDSLKEVVNAARAAKDKVIDIM